MLLVPLNIGSALQLSASPTRPYPRTEQPLQIAALARRPNVGAQGVLPTLSAKITHPIKRVSRGRSALATDERSLPRLVRPVLRLRECGSAV